MGFWDDNANIYEPGGVAGPAANGQPVQGTPGASGPEVGGYAPAAAVPGPMSNADAHNSTSAAGLTREQYRDAWMGSGAHSMADLQNFIKQNGGTLNAGNGVVTTPYGEQIDMLANARGSVAGRGTASASWGGVGGDAGPGPIAFDGGGGMPMPGGGFGGGGGGYGGGGGGGFNGAPGGWDGTKFTYNPIGAPTAYNPAAISADQVQGPGALNATMLANPEKFQGVSAADLAADPGVQFRQQQGMGTLANKFAASGLRGAGQAQAFADYNQNLASQEYGAAYGRKFGEFNNAFAQQSQATGQNNAANAQAYGLTNQYQQQAALANQAANLNARQFNAGRTDQAAQNNFANAFAVNQANNQGAQNAWQGNVNAQLGQGNLNLGYTQAANSYGVGMANVGLGYHSADQSYDLGLRNNALGYYGAQNSAANAAGQLGLGWANYGLNQQGQDFNQGLALTNVGLNAAGQYGNYAGAYGANAGGYATGAGNAGAAGANAGGQAWANGFNGAAGAAAGAAGLYYGNRRPPASGLLASGPGYN